ALGVGRGWALTAVAAGLGNLAAAAVHYPGPYVSIGASTAIFAALGVLTGHALPACFHAARPWWNAAVPAGGGLAFLGLYGAGGRQTDVVAHAAGFAAGLLVGLAAAGFGSGTSRKDPARELRPPA
ncbi:MAG: rhomboid family intramembrane serine protease, partial [Opitutaceae bacterium]